MPVEDELAEMVVFGRTVEEEGAGGGAAAGAAGAAAAAEDEEAAAATPDPRAGRFALWLANDSSDCLFFD